MQIIRLDLKLPKDLHSELKKISKEEGRSMGKQVLFIIKKYIKLCKIAEIMKEKLYSEEDI